MRMGRAIGFFGPLLALSGCAGVDQRWAAQTMPKAPLTPTTISRPSNTPETAVRSNDRVSRYFPLFRRAAGDTTPPRPGSIPPAPGGATVGEVPPPPLVRSRPAEPTRELPPLLPVTLNVKTRPGSSTAAATPTIVAARELPTLKATALPQPRRDNVVTTAGEETAPPELPPVAGEEAAGDSEVSPTGLPPVIEARADAPPLELEEDAARLAVQPKPRPVPIIRPVRGLRSPAPNPAAGDAESTDAGPMPDAAPPRLAAAYPAQPPVTTPAPEPDLVPPPPLAGDRKPGDAKPAAPAISSEPAASSAASPAAPVPNPAPQPADGVVVEDGTVYESTPMPTSISYQDESYMTNPPVPSKQCPPYTKKPCCLKTLKQKCCACLKQKCAAWKAHCPLKGFKQKCAGWKQKCCIFKKYKTCSSPQSMPVASCQSPPVPSKQCPPSAPVPCKSVPAPSKQCPVPSGQYPVEQMEPMPSGQWGLFSWRKPRTSTSSRPSLFAWMRPSRTVNPDAFGTTPANMPAPVFDQGAVAAAPRVNTAAPAPVNNNPRIAAPAPAPANNSPRIASPAPTGTSPRVARPAPAGNPGVAAASPLAASTYIPFAMSNVSVGNRAPADPAVATASRVQPAPKPQRVSLWGRFVRRIRGDREQTATASTGRSGRREADNLAQSRDDVQRVSANRLSEPAQR